MANRADLSPEDFERLLQWLGPDHDLSAKKYTELHGHLSRWFYFQGCRWSEDLADEVWNRIAKKLVRVMTLDKDKEFAEVRLFDLMTKLAIVQGKADQEQIELDKLHLQKHPLPILLGYARNVLREYRSEIIRFDEKHDPNEEVARVNDTGVEVRALCLELCLQRLDDDDRQLLQEYHKYEPGRKIEHRKAMANARQSTLNAIRLKVSRLMSNLRNCVKGCCRSRGLEVQ
jgi:hypothetical protein